MIKILCDSISDVPSNIIDNYGVEIIPLRVLFDGKEYLDRVEITHDDFYSKLRNSNIMPKTSQATYAQFKEFFDKYKDTETQIIYMAGSSNASGTMQSAILAKSEGYDNVTIFDTNSLSIGSALFVIKACEMIKEGYQVSEIINKLEELKTTETVLFSVDDLKYLKMGGRISSTKASIGNLLNIKPILTMENGLVVQKSQARGKKQVINNFYNEIINKYGNDLSDRTIIVGYSDIEEDLESMKKIILEKINPKDIYFVNIGCLICSHSGPGVFGVSCI